MEHPNVEPGFAYFSECLSCQSIDTEKPPHHEKKDWYALHLLAKLAQAQDLQIVKSLSDRRSNCIQITGLREKLPLAG